MPCNFLCSHNSDTNTPELLEPDNDAQKNFQSTINRFLDAENLIVLCGSGVSLTFNSSENKIAPSMWDLWEACSKNDETIFTEILTLIDYAQFQINKEEDGSPKPDIELLLSLCEGNHKIGVMEDNNRTKIASFLETAKKIILHQTDFTSKIQPENWATHEKFMRILGRRDPNQQRLKIFTTNYDLAFEETASRTGFIVIDGFEFTTPSYFNPTWYQYDIVNRHGKSQKHSYINNVIHLYKMHGSIDWKKDNEGRIKKTTDSDQGEPVFIYPSSSKYQSSYDSPYLEMMSAFLNLVQQPKTAVICIGFGFNDKHINNAMTMALRTNPDFMLMVSTRSLFKTEGSFNSNMRDLFTGSIKNGDGRISLIDSDFNSFVSQLPDRRSSAPEEKVITDFAKLFSGLSNGASE